MSKLINVTLTRDEWVRVEEYLTATLEDISSQLYASLDEMSALDRIIAEIKKQVV